MSTNDFTAFLADDAAVQAFAQRLAPIVAQYSINVPTCWGDWSRVHIGSRAQVVNALFNVASGEIFIGDDTFFGHNVCVLTGTHDVAKIGVERMQHPTEGRDIRIGEGVWIASNATILGPCTIGDHAVVCAGSVVVGDVESGWLYGGVPARPIRPSRGEQAEAEFAASCSPDSSPPSCEDADGVAALRLDETVLSELPGNAGYREEISMSVLGQEPEQVTESLNVGQGGDLKKVGDMHDKLTIVVPLKISGGHYTENGRRFNILMRSLKKFFNASQTKIAVVCPDDELDQVKELCGPDILVITDGMLVPSIGETRATNWMKQQFLKLNAVLYFDTPFCMTLDPDNFATTYFDINTLIRDERASIDFIPQDDHFEWWTACANMVGLNPADLPARVMHVTPCIYAKEGVELLRQDLEEKHGMPWSELLLAYNENPNAPVWIENGIYYLNLVRRGLLDKYHFDAVSEGVERLHNTNEVWIVDHFRDWKARRCFDGSSNGIFCVVQSNTSLPADVIDKMVSPFFEISTDMQEKVEPVPRGVIREKFDAFLELFEVQYAAKTATRASGFRTMFNLVANMRLDSYTIIETGCSRKADGDGIVYGDQVPVDHPWYPGGSQGPWADGQSTFLFDKFVTMCGGHVYSVDIDPYNCEVAKKNSSNNVSVFCHDSVSFLRKLDSILAAPKTIDLLYLDSFDLDWDNPHPSALHHIKELVSAAPFLRRGSVVAIDDNLLNGKRGKGLYVNEYLRDIGALLLEDAYQSVWIWP
jgi:acetyltransferase-like isoleucine patch superfamily enzyme